jgi:hypothetical protein
MSMRRAFGVSLALLALGGCATPQGSQAPIPLKPEDGPKGSIRVGYMGGLIHRTLTAYFRTDRNAYVLVGHLGGDGLIRVLYPSDPRDPGFVSANKTWQTDMFNTQYDGLPSLFSYSVASFRSINAAFDSYDGRGHGYVFMIASHMPLRSNVLAEGNEWMEWEVTNYQQQFDPRWAVRDFAEAVAGGGYTLEYATAFNSTRYDAYASQAWDCSVISTLGFSYSPFWSTWGYSPYGRASSFSNCFNSYSSGYRGRYGYLNGLNVNGYNVPTVFPTLPTTPSTPAPQLDRPGRRGLGPQDGTTTRELTTTGVALHRRTAPVERTEIIARPSESPRQGRADRRRNEEQDLATRSAIERRREMTQPRGRGTTTVDRSERTRESEPTRSTTGETSRGGSSSGTSSSTSRGESSSGTSSTSRDGGSRSVTPPREARRPSGG